VDGWVSEANGTAERHKAEAMDGAVPCRHLIKAYYTQDFVADTRALGNPRLSPKHEQPALGDRWPDPRHSGYALS
jgi:hypothetical protein